MIKNSHTLKFAAIALVAMVALTLTFLSCDKSGPSAQNKSEADSLIYEAKDAADYKRIVELCDSLEQTGDISPIKSAYLRGEAYRFMEDPRRAEEVLKPVMDMEPTNAKDSDYYINCVCGMVEVLLHKNDFEGVLRIGLPMLEKMNAAEGEKHHFYGILSQFVGAAQSSLGMKEDAAKSYDMCYNYQLELSAANPVWQNVTNIFACAFNICITYLGKRDYESAEMWYQRQDSVLTFISERDDVPASILDRLVAGNCLARAKLRIGQKKMGEADRAIIDYNKTARAKTVDGQIDCAGVLLDAERYAEAADAFVGLDEMFAEQCMEVSLENLTNYTVNKFMANYKAGRRDSALAVAAYIAEHLDSAFMKQKNSDAAELATVYQTQQKDAEIAQQPFLLSRFYCNL